jgi:hypothetical protein
MTRVTTNFSIQRISLRIQGFKKATQAAHDHLLRISTAYSFLTVPDSGRHADAYTYTTSHHTTPVCTPLLVGGLGCFDLPVEQTPKRTLGEIDTVMYHPAESPNKKIKLHQQESVPPPFIIRTSIKRDSWAVEQSSRDSGASSSTPSKNESITHLHMTNNFEPFFETTTHTHKPYQRTTIRSSSTYLLWLSPLPKFFYPIAD